VSDIQPIARIVFHAPTRGRSYLTARAAAKAEAGALLAKKYPTERPDYCSDSGMMIDCGWHWTGDDRLVRVHARLAKMLQRRVANAIRPAASMHEGGGKTP
jgi:hypothetical protein